MAAAARVSRISGLEATPVISGPLPGPNARDITERDHRFLATTTKTAPIAAKQARGSVVLDVDGNVFLDFTSGVGVVNTGHGHPAVVKAIQEQAAELVHFAGTDFYYEQQARLAERLAGILPGNRQRKVFFCNSGTEANEAAMKVVRWSSRQSQFLAFRGAFHGRTMGSLALTSSKTVQRERFFPMMPGVHTVPYPNPYRNVFGIDGQDEPERLIDVVLAMIEDTLETTLPASEAGAMFVEPILGEGGYVVPPKGFLSKLARLLKQQGVLMVTDEIQSGFGRSGRMFASEHEDVVPDLITMAKSLGSGFPIGACGLDAGLDFGVRGAHSTTFGGNVVACAAALATLDVFENEDLVERSRKRGQELGQRLTELKSAHASIGDARGLGLMRAIEFVSDAKKRTPDAATRDAVLGAAFRRGLLLLPCGVSAIRVIPPLVVTSEQIDGACRVLEEAVAEATK